MLMVAAAVLSLAAGPALGASELQRRVEQLLSTHPDRQGRPMRLEWTARPSRLPACAQGPELVLLPAQRLPGWVRVQAVCKNPVWERNLQLRVHLQLRYLAARRNLMSGHVLGQGDLVMAEGDSAKLGDDLATDLSAVIGQELRRPLTRGSPLRLNTLRPLTVIQKGNQVVLILRGTGFEIETMGLAMNNAAIGQELQVQVKEGTIVTARARAAGVAETP
jgi:flagellar basal body P-ring formation protein FlgA